MANLYECVLCVYCNKYCDKSEVKTDSYNKIICDDCSQYESEASKLRVKTLYGFESLINYIKGIFFDTDGSDSDFIDCDNNTRQNLYSELVNRAKQAMDKSSEGYSITSDSKGFLYIDPYSLDELLAHLCYEKNLNWDNKHSCYSK